MSTRTTNFILAMVQSQLINLCATGPTTNTRAAARPCAADDEFANIGQIPKL